MGGYSGVVVGCLLELGLVLRCCFKGLERPEVLASPMAEKLCGDVRDLEALIVWLSPQIGKFRWGCWG